MKRLRGKALMLVALGIMGDPDGSIYGPKFVSAGKLPGSVQNIEFNVGFLGDSRCQKVFCSFDILGITDDSHTCLIKGSFLSPIDRTPTGSFIAEYDMVNGKGNFDVV